MRHPYPFRAATAVLLLTLSFFSLTEAWAQPPEANSTRDALATIFSPHRAPPQKTMGLLQRSFLDLVETEHQQLQVALVVDGTNSMESALEGVRSAMSSMAADLARYKGEHVSFAVVIYRDLGAASGEVVLPLKGFTRDLDVLEQAISDIKPESGAPYFPELVDLGVHAALERLPWSDDAETARWVFLFADAPPLDADFDEAKTGAKRRYSTDLLIQLAKRRGVTINCVVCESSSQFTVYDQALPQTRRFTNDLATGTGGLMLDLSYPDIRKAIHEAARQTAVEYQGIGRITPAEVASVRAQAPQAEPDLADSQRVRLAILPHLPLGQMTFDPENPAVGVASELRMKFRQLPRVELRSTVAVEQQVRRLKRSDLTDSQFLQALAARLRVDYVVWGGFRQSAGGVEVRSAIYKQETGAKLAEASLAMQPAATLVGGRQIENQALVVGGTAQRLITSSVDQIDAHDDAQLRAVLAAYRDASSRQMLTPLAESQAERQTILAGYESLEQALAQDSGSREATKLVESAVAHLQKAVELAPRNPWPHFLLASCFYNETQAAQKRGDAEAVREKAKLYAQALNRAYRFKDAAPSREIGLEIEADYLLLVERNIAAAIEKYQQLAGKSGSPTLDAARRAHWMLAAIRSGDWGVDAKFVDPKQAKEHLIAILAHWPDSSEAAYIKANLRWDEEKGGNQMEYYPQVNDDVVAALTP